MTTEAQTKRIITTTTSTDRMIATAAFGNRYFGPHPLTGGRAAFNTI